MRFIFRVLLLALMLGAVSGSVAAQSTQPIFIYVASGQTSRGLGIVSAFKGDPTTGTLSVVAGSPFQVAGYAEGVAADPAGRFLYVIDNSSSLYSYTIDGTSGALTLVPGSPIAVGSNPSAIAIDPTGRFLYVSRGIPTAGNGALAVFSLDPVSGAPTPITGSPFTLPAAPLPLSVDPNGNFLYFGSNEAVTTESIDFETGTPSFVANAGYGENIVYSPFSSYINGTASISADPLDRFAVVNGTAIYTIDHIDGSLQGLPSETNPNTGNSAFDPFGRFVYSSSGAIGTANQIDPESGALTPVVGATFSPADPQLLAVDPTGRFIYGLSGLGGSESSISGYTIDQTTGAPTSIPSSTLSMVYGGVIGLPAIVLAPSGVTNPTPSVSSLSPTSVTAAGPAFTLTVTGSNFMPGSRVYYSGRGRVTTYVSSTELTANIYASDIGYGGTGVVFVFNPLPGGGASPSVELSVPDPVPSLTSISPTSVVAGGNGFTLILTGTSFQPASVVTFNGSPRTTTFVNYDEVQVAITAADIAAPGTPSIAVTTPAINGLGGGTSGSATLTISPANVPPPVIVQIAPGSATAGGPSFPLSISGTGFTSTAGVRFGSATVALTNYNLANSPQTLTVSIPASAITAPGTVPVIVSTAGGVSTAAAFYVENPPPTAGGVNPPVVPAGAAALTLNISRSGFTSSSAVLVNGSSRVTTFVSATSLQAMLLASDISHGGTLTITVSTPGPGGGVSAPITLTVADYAISAGSASSSIAAGQVATFALTVAPSNGAYGNPVTFSVSGLPTGASASFSPSATVTPGSASTSVTLSISTTARAFVPVGRSFRWPFAGVALLSMAGLALILAGIGLGDSQSRLRRPALQFVFVVALAMAAGLVGCSSGSGGATTQPTGPSGGTPAGSYSVVVTATSGADVHTTTVTLTVN